MIEKKERSKAQCAADRRYEKKNKHRQKVISFKLSAVEAVEIEKAIAATGLTKAEFLRQAVKKF